MIEKIAANPKNIVIAQNQYFADKVEYHTGLRIPVLASAIFDYPVTYPTKKAILVANFVN